MNVTLKGQPVELEGSQVQVGDKAPNFSLPDVTNTLVELSTLTNKPTVISVIPDIDTGICSLQTKRFNQETANLPDINFVTISNNTLEEQKNWCAAEGVDMMMLRDEDAEFGKNYGLYIPAINKLARALFVVDSSGKIAFAKINDEIGTEPDYDEALTVAKNLS